MAMLNNQRVSLCVSVCLSRTKVLQLLWGQRQHFPSRQLRRLRLNHSLCHHQKWPMTKHEMNVWWFDEQKDAYIIYQSLFWYTNSSIRSEPVLPSLRILHRLGVALRKSGVIRRCNRSAVELRSQLPTRTGRFSDFTAKRMIERLSNI